MIIAVLGHYKLIKPTLDYSVDEIDEALAVIGLKTRYLLMITVNS